MIGKGSFAEVRVAWHVLTGTEVAVKAGDLKDFLDFLQEVHCLKNLNHPNIIRLFEVITTQDKAYLFMKHVSRGQLFDYLENCGPMTEKEAQALFHQLLSTVEYCHRKNIVHWDLKPENILLDGGLNVKFADFGFSKECRDEKLTTFCDTISYMAPEIL